MAKINANAKYNLVSPERRKILEGKDYPSWWIFDRGRSLGFCRGLSVSSWFVRLRLKEKRYHQIRLGESDDIFSANGESVLSFEQAYKKAADWCEQNANAAIPKHLGHEGNPVYPVLPPAPPYTVAHAAVDYMKWYRDNRNGFSKIYYNMRAYFLPKFGYLPVEQLTTRMLREWVDEIAETPARLRFRKDEKTQYKIKTNTPEEIRQRRQSANCTLAIAKAALNRAYEHGFVDSN